MPQHPGTVPIDSFKGLNNVLRPENTPQDFLKKAENIDIDKSGKIHKRKGYTKVDTGVYTSLWASENGNGCYGVKDGNLVRIHDDYSTSLVRSNVGPDPISFDEINNQIFYSSISVNGVIENGISRSWGIASYLPSPTLSSVTGSLDSGTYQVTFTLVRSNGLDGGSPIPSVITVAQNGGITFTMPSSPDPDLLYARVYVSTRDGVELYYHGVVNFGSTYTISDVRENINILRSADFQEAPLGHIVKYYMGRIYIVNDNTIYYSEPFQYENFNLAEGFIQYDKRIKEFLPVEDGIWVASDKLYYISGNNPSEFKSDVKEDIKIVEGTAKRISGSYILMENTPIGFKWLVTSDLGIFVLFNQGMVINLTSQNLALEQADSGASAFIQENGMNQYVSMLKTNNDPNNSVFGDFVEAKIIRNGVII
jgi:hypothetical protein